VFVILNTNAASQYVDESLNQLTLTFTNNYEEIIGKSKDAFLQDCSQAIHDLGDFLNIYCIDVNRGHLGSIVITLEGPQKERKSLSYFIMKNKVLFIPNIALLILKENVKVMKVEHEEEQENSNFIQDNGFLIITGFIFVIIVALFLCYSCLCENHFSVIVKDKDVESQNDIEAIASAATIMKVSSVENGHMKRTPSGTCWSSEGEQEPQESRFPQVIHNILVE